MGEVVAAVFTGVAAEVVFTAEGAGVGLVLMAADVLWAARAEQRHVRFQGQAALMGIAAMGNDLTA
jgi:hypothetical protein